MTDVKTILGMIEAVDPKDTAKLNEIDARVDCFLAGYEFAGHPDPEEKHYEARTVGGHAGFFTPETFTTSRDALKSIRPKGWNVCGPYACATALGYNFSLHEMRAFGKKVIGTGMLKTEELAELHAVIQAIAHSRGDQE